MKKNIIMLSSIVLMLMGVGVSTNKVQASTLSTTPIAAYRYKYKTAYYFDQSTSNHYKSVWSQAINAWKNKGFGWKKASNHSKTTLSSYTSNDTSITGYDHVQYNQSTGQIVSSEVRLNRSAFQKWNYDMNDQIHVAEHELGHAVGLNHNNPGSVSVMNPANRYYSIQTCDVNGMNQRYSTVAPFDVVPGTENQIVSITVYETVKPEIRKITTKYNSNLKKVSISGLATKGEKVIINYNGKKVKIAKVNNGHFTADVKFVGYKPFTIYAVNSKDKRITPISKVTSNKYAAKTPVAIKSSRTKKGINYTFSTIPNSNLVMYYQGNKILTKKTSFKTTKVFIPAKKLKNKKGHFIVKQLQKGKKSSPASKAEIVKIGVASVLNY